MPDTELDVLNLDGLNLDGDSLEVTLASSRVSGADFAKLLTTEILQESMSSYEGPCDRLQQENLLVIITPQGLAHRMTGARVENYRHAVLQQPANTNLQPTVETVESQWLAPSGRICLQDGTPGQLAAAFFCGKASGARAGLGVATKSITGPVSLGAKRRKVLPGLRL